MKNHEKEQVMKNFSQNASYYVTNAIHAKGDDLQTIIEWLQPNKTWNTLDIATGGGHVAKALSPHVKQVMASDLTKEMLEAASNFLSDGENIQYIIADAENLPLLDESFDAVTCRIAAHHFPNPEKFINEVYRVLKPNGKFILIDNIAPEEDHLATFMNTFEKLRDNSHVKALKWSEWKSLLENIGLSVERNRIRKKQFIFNNWVNRTTDSDEQREEVEVYLLNGSNITKDYFEIQINNHHVESLKIDELMVLCTKN